jgi:segregation and condensation protein B
VLFLSREPLSSRKAAHLADLADGTEARTLIRRLNGYYAAEGRAFSVEEVAGGYQLLTRPQFGPWLRRIGQATIEGRISPLALETLAVVAYRQPVPRAEVEAIRGVQCGEVLRQLMDRDLIRIAGRSEELGRPFLYATTRRFLQVFGLRSVADLPRADRLRAGAGPVAKPDDSHHNSPLAPGTRDAAPSPPNDVEEESEVTKVPRTELDPRDLIDPSSATVALEERPGEIRSARFGAEPSALDPRAPRVLPWQDEITADDEDDDFEDEDEEDDDEEDEEDDDEDWDEDEDDLEDDEWEEVDDDDELDEDEDDDWDEEDEDDDWDDDEDDEDEDEDDEADGGEE